MSSARLVFAFQPSFARIAQERIHLGRTKQGAIHHHVVLVNDIMNIGKIARGLDVADCDARRTPPAPDCDDLAGAIGYRKTVTLAESDMIKWANGVDPEGSLRITQ